MTIGLVFVVFGKACDQMAAHCIKYSRQYTKLPICVLTNMNADERCDFWKQINNVQFQHFYMPTEQNREIKTQLYKYTPFDYTVYIDADAIVQHKDFDADVISWAYQHASDITLNHFCRYPDKENRFQNIYLRASKQFNCIWPLNVYNGAFIGFRNNNRVKNFFDLWNRYWKEFGANREMPPLACAINTSPEVSVFRLPDNWFEPDSKNDKAVVQHNYHQDFFQRIGMNPVEMQQASYHVDDYKFTTIEPS